MIDRAGKRAARRTMAEAVPERDINRLLAAARPAAGDPQDDLADPTGMNRRGPVDAPVGRHDGAGETVLTDNGNGPDVTLWDLPVFVLYACLGVFSRIWTDITLQFDFGADNGFRLFAVAVLVALHGIILLLVVSAWRAKWALRARNLTAIAALAGYLGCRLITQF